MEYWGEGEEVRWVEGIRGWRLWISVVFGHGWWVEIIR